MLDKLKDERVQCYSALIEMKLGEYLELVEEAYKASGGIEGQRAPLKTKTAVSIRQRLVSDIKDGAIVPPLVIGVLLEKADYETVGSLNSEQALLDLVKHAGSNRLSVIDGMQRTTAMLEAAGTEDEAKNRKIRVEFWLAERVNSLIYRMLVLNTGQVPWEIGRQLETIYGQFLSQIEDSLGETIEIFHLDERRRRVQPGQYQSKTIIELLLLFSSRKSEIDVRDRVAEDFARLDAIETTSHTEFIDYFIATLHLMGKLDAQLANATQEDSEDVRLKTGRDIFASFPAMAGFFSAVSVELFDEPGFKIDWSKAADKMAEVSESLGALIEKMEGMDKNAVSEFVQLQLLEEKLTQRSGQVGRFERELFRRAFSSMIRNATRLDDLTPCWMA